MFDFEQLGQEFCNSAKDQTNFEYYTQRIGLIVIFPFFLLAVFDQRLKKNMDQLYRAMMVTEVAVGCLIVQQTGICRHDFYTTVFDQTFVKVIGIQASRDQLNGVLFFSDQVFTLLFLQNFIALSLVFSFEIIDIIKNPFSAQINNRQNYYWLSMIFMTLIAPLIVFFEYGKGQYLSEIQSPDEELEKVQAIFYNIAFIFQQVEIVIIIFALVSSYKGIWKREGINANIKRSIMGKQLLWIIFRLSIDTIIIASFVIKQLSIIDNDFYHTVQFLFLNTCQILFLFVCFTDQAFLVVVVGIFTVCMRKDKKPDLDLLFNIIEKQSDPKNAFLFSSINLESVCSILTGVSNVIMKDLSSQEQFERQQDFNKASYTKKCRCVITEIEVIKQCFYENACCFKLEKIIRLQNSLSQNKAQIRKSIKCKMLAGFGQKKGRNSINNDQAQQFDQKEAQQFDQKGVQQFDYKKIQDLKLPSNDEFLQELERYYMYPTQKIKTNVKIAAYAPEIFSYIRWFDGLVVQDLIESLAPINNRRQIFKASKGQKHQSGGKSGSFFFFTEDRSLIIKTIVKDEFDKYLKILPDMVKHLQLNPDSLIQRIYGLYEIHMPAVYQPLYIMIQRNALKIPEGNKLLMQFDLKGSTFCRQTLPSSTYELPSRDFGYNLIPQKIQKCIGKRGETLKDLDWLKLKNMFGLNLQIEPQIQLRCHQILKNDIEFLQKSAVMDYSLLLGVVEVNNEEESDSTTDSSKGIYSQDGKYLYKFGIIDYLSTFRLNKQLEVIAKTTFQNAKKSELSAMRSKPYGNRYLHFMNSEVFSISGRRSVENKYIKLLTQSSIDFNSSVLESRHTL